MQQLNRLLSVCALAAVLAGGAFAAKLESHTSGPFQGPKANTGTVTHSTENGKSMLRVSDDFKVPDTPAPTGAWWIRRETSTRWTPSRSRGRSAEMLRSARSKFPRT